MSKTKTITLGVSPPPFELYSIFSKAEIQDRKIKNTLNYIRTHRLETHRLDNSKSINKVLEEILDLKEERNIQLQIYSAVCNGSIDGDQTKTRHVALSTIEDIDIRLNYVMRTAREKVAASQKMKKASAKLKNK